jgi:squalene cyclase
MAAVDIAGVERVIADEYRYFLANRAGWSLTAGPQDLELVAHALRVLLHARAVADYAEDFGALVDAQNPDGGWGQESTSAESAVWVSAFCALMLIRGNQVLHDERIAAGVRHAVDYFLAAQHDDGHWVDPRWADLDTTSHPVSFFDVCAALGETHRRAEAERSRVAGLRFILGQQAADGGWYDADFHPSGVEITAHLIQDSLIADVLLGDAVGVRDSCARGLACLRRWQAADGSWDDENVDHTMDCTRSSIVVARLLGETASDASIERGMSWILGAKNPNGWGDFPGMETNLERLCDGIDTLLKFKSYTTGQPRDVARLWGYVP